MEKLLKHPDEYQDNHVFIMPDEHSTCMLCRYRHFLTGKVKKKDINSIKGGDKWKAIVLLFTGLN